MVKRSLPRRPSSFSSRRAAALPGEIETTEIPPFPVGFCRSTEELLGGSDARSLLAALDTPSPVSVRFNPYKVQGPSGQRISGNDPSVNPTGESVVVTGEKPIDSAPFSQGTDSGGTPLIRPAQLAGNEVPWCRYGYYLPQRPSFTLDPAFHAGAYYVQEAGSMFVERIFRQLFEPDTPLRILDLCAAPGGKTTLLSTLAGASGLVVANEVIRQRAGTLVDNVRKWGIGNTLVTNNDPSHFASLRHYFDLVLVDAPCSGEGMFRKTPGARTEWSEANVKLCAARGRRILGDVWEALRPGGILVYSTCTFNVQENEETVEWLASEYDCEPVDVTADPAWGIVQGEAAGMATFRFSRTAYSPKGSLPSCCVKATVGSGCRFRNPAKRYLHRWRVVKAKRRPVGSASRSRCFSSGSARISMPITRRSFRLCGKYPRAFQYFVRGCCAVSFSEESCDRNIRSRCSMTFRAGRFRLWNCRPMKRSLICARRISPRSGCRRESTSSPSTACRWDGSNASAHAATTCTRRSCGSSTCKIGAAVCFTLHSRYLCIVCPISAT